MLMRTTRRTALGIGMALAAAGPARAAPQRIVSLNPCLDTMLVHLADRAQIAALSHYARQDSQSTIASVARTLPFTYENAEEIIGKSPDLVLASTHSGLGTRRALARLGVKVLTFVSPNSVDESLAQIRTLSQAIGQSPRAEALIAKIEIALAEARPRTARRPIKTLVFQPRGLVAGRGTLVDEMMQRTGFENVAGRYGVKSWGTLPLEPLIADPPELLLTAESAPGAGTWSTRLAQHPALAEIHQRMRRAVFPEACLYCGGPVLLQTAPILAKARDDYWGGA